MGTRVLPPQCLRTSSEQPELEDEEGGAAAVHCPQGGPSAAERGAPPLLCKQPAQSRPHHGPRGHLWASPPVASPSTLGWVAMQHEHGHLGSTSRGFEFCKLRTTGCFLSFSFVLLQMVTFMGCKEEGIPLPSQGFSTSKSHGALESSGTKSQPCNHSASSEPWGPLRWDNV